MAENSHDDLDRTEEPTPERREEFREKGQIAVSREITSVVSLAMATSLLTICGPIILNSLIGMMKVQFQNLGKYSITTKTFLDYSHDLWFQLMEQILPLFFATSIIATVVTFLQTNFNWSWKKIIPDFKRLNPFSGLKRIVSFQALNELIKGCGKMAVISVVGYLIIFGEMKTLPTLLNVSIENVWKYWGEITELLFWSAASLMVIVAGADYMYHYLSVENKLKMTRQEVKEEAKKREVDPQVKGRIRKIQRDLAMAKMIKETKTATLVVTNPEHYAVALKYQMGMVAPLVVAKGKDNKAMKIKEVAKKFEVPIVENKPLARTLFKIVEVGETIPQSLYLAVSEVIRYVYWLKGMPLNSSRENS